MSELCEVISLAKQTCCDPETMSTAIVINNSPAQRSLRYRLDTFASFRRRMLVAIPESLPRWSDLSSRDYGIFLLEMWATLGDILTFYQERIANESFLRTAILRDSLLQIAAMVDYRPNPGAAAEVYLTFTLDKDKVIELPQGFRVQSKTAPNSQPVPFEADEALKAFSSLNLMRARSLQGQSLGFGDRDAILQGVHTGLEPGDRILVVGKERLKDPGSENWDTRRVSEVIPDKDSDTTRVVWKEPLGHLMPRVEPAAGPEVHALRLQVWPFGYNAPDYASLIISTTATITDTNGETEVTTSSEPAFEDWTGKTLPEDRGNPDHIFLDAVYDTIVADSWIVLVTSEPVAITPGGSITHPQGYAEAYRVKQVDETVIQNYTMTSKVSRLTVDGIKDDGKVWPEHIEAFPMQGTSVLAQSEHLALAQVPITIPVAGDTITLDAIYSDLERGRLLLIKGHARDGTQDLVEVASVKDLSHTDTGTVITLSTNLQHSYDPTTLEIFGNVVVASQGETIEAEILGNGDASQQFQRFMLQKSPLTFLRASGPEANRWGTQAAIEVRVDGALWKERDNLLGSESTDRHYNLGINAEDLATITFGSGAFVDEKSDDDQKVLGGARLPTGVDNVRTRYRKGLGLSGNVGVGEVNTLVSSAPGLKSVVNYLPGTGGADREREDQMKVNVPTVMRAFDRAVSLEDYAALARTYSGVAKARAFWQIRDPDDPSGRRRLEQPRVLLTVAATDANPPLQPIFRDALRGFLNARRDPNQPLVIADYTPIDIELTVRIEPDSDLIPEKISSDVRAALGTERNPDGTFGLFAFDRLDFGQSLHLSDVYALVQGVSGVEAALVTRFRHKPRPGEAESPAIEKHIFIRNTEILHLDDLSIEIVKGLVDS